MTDYSAGAFLAIILAALAFGIGCYSYGYDRHAKGKQKWSNKPFKTLVVIAIVLFGAMSAEAGTATWILPTEYTDATPIATADIARITTNLYYSSSSTGPWTFISTTAAGATTATVPDPAKGTTRWYTADCTLDGMTGPKGVAASKTVPFPTPKGPTGITIQ